MEEMEYAVHILKSLFQAVTRLRWACKDPQGSSNSSNLMLRSEFYLTSEQIRIWSRTASPRHVRAFLLCRAGVFPNPLFTNEAFNEESFCTTCPLCKTVLQEPMLHYMFEYSGFSDVTHVTIPIYPTLTNYTNNKPSLQSMCKK